MSSNDAILVRSISYGNTSLAAGTTKSTKTAKRHEMATGELWGAGKKGDGRQEGRSGSRRGVLGFFVLFVLFGVFRGYLGDHERHERWRNGTKGEKK